MPLPVIAQTRRVTWNWAPIGGVPIAHNVVHVNCLDAVSDVDVADKMASALVANIFNAVSSSFELQSMDVLRLDGTSTTTTRTFTTTPKGTGTGEGIRNSSMVCSLKTATRGPANRGRIYLPFLAESVTNNGVVAGATVTAASTAWNAYLTSLSTGSPALILVVASYLNGNAHAVTSVRCDTVVGTQRRRLKALRVGGTD